jgi:hypothetical protein
LRAHLTSFHVWGGEESGTQRQIRHFDAPFAKRGWLRLGVAVRTRQASIASRDYESHDVQAVPSPFGGSAFYKSAEGNAIRFFGSLLLPEARLTILYDPDSRGSICGGATGELTFQAVIATTCQYQ